MDVFRRFAGFAAFAFPGSSQLVEREGRILVDQQEHVRFDADQPLEGHDAEVIQRPRVAARREDDEPRDDRRDPLRGHQADEHDEMRDGEQDPESDREQIAGSGRLDERERRGIWAATIVPARAMKLDAELGTIERGKRADLVVLYANPLEAVHNIPSVRWTITDGRIYDAAALWKSVRFQPWLRTRTSRWRGSVVRASRARATTSRSPSRPTRRCTRPLRSAGGGRGPAASRPASV